MCGAPANIRDEDVLFDAHPPRKSARAAVRLPDLSPCEHRRTIDRIRYDFYDSYLHNLEAGSPTGLIRETVVASSDCHWKAGRRNRCNRKRGQDYSTTLPMCEKDCITFAREQQ